MKYIFIILFFLIPFISLCQNKQGVSGHARVSARIIGPDEQLIVVKDTVTSKPKVISTLYFTQKIINDSIVKKDSCNRVIGYIRFKSLNAYFE